MFKASNDLSFSLLAQRILPFSKLLLPLVPPLLHPTPSDHGVSDNTLNPVCRLPELVPQWSFAPLEREKGWRSTKRSKERAELKEKKTRAINISRMIILHLQYIRFWETRRVDPRRWGSIRPSFTIEQGGRETWSSRHPRSVLDEGCSTECRESTWWQIARNE